MALTRRQKEVLDFIAAFVDDNGYSPSYEEIAIGLELASLATVHKHISSLVSKGYLTRGANQSRSLELSPRYLEQQRQYHSARIGMAVPLAGRIAAGSPVETFETHDTLSFADFRGGSETFALEVRGDSMIEDHIMSGDYVLVERTESARDGDVVVALVDGAETTLKRYFREADGMIRLQPANSEMNAILLTPERVQIQGKLLAVMRKFS